MASMTIIFAVDFDFLDGEVFLVYALIISWERPTKCSMPSPTSKLRALFLSESGTS